MNFYNKNMEVIQKTREFLYQKMQEMDFAQRNENEEMVQSVETKDGNMAIVYQNETGNYRFNSAYKPVAEATKWVEQFQFQHLNIIASMFGLGNGIFARQIMESLGEQDMLFIMEPSIEVFLHTLHNYDITDILAEERVSISVEGINPEEFATLANECINWTNLGSQIQCVHPQYDKAFPEEYRKFRKRLKDIEVRAIVNKNTEAYWGRIMTRNEIKNIKYLKNCNILSDLVEKIENDIPIIIVSAGPSLDNNIEKLKDAKGKAVILATDSSLKYLFSHDIIPDMVITLDATKAPFHFVDERFKKIPLLCKTVSNPDVLEKHQGKKVFFYNEDFISTILTQLGRNEIYYEVGGSVSTAAFSVSIGLGFKRIILIGQDLCYQGDKTHAGGMVHNAHGSGEGATMMVEDIYGNMVRARYDWYTYLIWFQDAIAVCSHVDVIDATEGGAKIQGTKIMTLAEVIEQYCLKEFDVGVAIEQMRPTIQPNEYGLVEEYFQSSVKDLIQIEKMAKEAKDICNRLIFEAKRNNVESYTGQDLVKRISKYNKKIAEKSVFQLVNDYIADVTTKQIDNINQLTLNQQENQIRTYTKSREVYAAIVEAVEIIKPLLEDAVIQFNS